MIFVGILGLLLAVVLLAVTIDILYDQIKILDRRIDTAMDQIGRIMKAMKGDQ